ncbi:MAG TPA: 5-oxoprolinase subunit PxpA [Actinomycetota bacterium]|nr:5-oxoprolinase subunit PxpA [Actinomycetota bacterium]
MASEASRRIDLNADVGEGLPPEVDRSLMEVVTSASIACGGHAGDPDTMRRTLDAARELGIRVGAHPSYPDREGFGRRSMDLAPQALRSSIEQQVAALCDAASLAGVEVAYLKPHGALYNDAAVNSELIGLLLDLGRDLGLPLMLLGGAVEREIRHDDARPLPRLIREGFLDRRYTQDGALVPRDRPGALISDPETAARQALVLAPSVDSLCVHSDSPSALYLVRYARSALETAGYQVGP